MTVKTTLVLGANTVITQSKCSVGFSSADNLSFGEQIGLLWLPLDEQRKAVSSPAYLHEPKDWATLDSKDHPSQWQLDLDTLFKTQGASFVQLIAYAYYEPTLNLPAVELNGINLTINGGAIDYNYQANERHIKAAIILEIYQRSGQYKCRALGETVTSIIDTVVQICGRKCVSTFIVLLTP